MSLFQRKRNIQELLKGFKDMHCHVLPGIDDGSPDIDYSIALLLKYKELGINGLIATPHILKGAHPNTAETIAASFQSLQEALEANKLSDFIQGTAAEHMLDEDVMAMVEQQRMLKLSGNYVLIEMSYYQRPSGLKNSIFQILQKGYVPILAHPERYQFLHKMDDYRELKQRGCEFQLNLLSLSDHYGPDVKKKAHQMLKLGMYDFAGTDTHRLRHLESIARLQVPTKLYAALQKVMERTTQLVDQA